MPRRRASSPAPSRSSAPVARTDDEDAFLVALGERVRGLRARRGITRRALADGAAVSERHLANLELGQGNASVLVLRQVAQALGASLAELLGDETTATAEGLLIRELLHGRDDADLQRARLALARLFRVGAASPDRRAQRIALIGLRGAGKSTLGQRLADALGRPFVELDHAIERIAGCSVAEIHSLYGPNAYRRYERRALDEVLEAHPAVVIATPGGVVSEAATFQRVLSECLTVWLQASPEEHMARVIAQGDTRPMAGNREAMDDLKRILATRAALYAKADIVIDTSGRPIDAVFETLRVAVTSAAA
jgi:XRE family aerobic/anaerobic benzoate catabolism transcriptional regulator